MKNSLVSIEDTDLELVHGGMWARFQEVLKNSTAMGNGEIPKRVLPPPTQAQLAQIPPMPGAFAPRPWPYTLPANVPSPGHPQMSSAAAPKPIQWPGAKLVR